MYAFWVYVIECLTWRATCTQVFIDEYWRMLNIVLFLVSSIYSQCIELVIWKTNISVYRSDELEIGFDWLSFILSYNLNINKINLNCYAINKFFEHKSPQITPLIMIKLDSSFLMWNIHPIFLFWNSMHSIMNFYT